MLATKPSEPTELSTKAAPTELSKLSELSELSKRRVELIGARHISGLTRVGLCRGRSTGTAHACRRIPLQLDRFTIADPRVGMDGRVSCDARKPRPTDVGKPKIRPTQGELLLVKLTRWARTPASAAAGTTTTTTNSACAATTNSACAAATNSTPAARLAVGN